MPPKRTSSFSRCLLTIVLFLRLRRYRCCCLVLKRLWGSFPYALVQVTSPFLHCCLNASLPKTKQGMRRACVLTITQNKRIGSRLDELLDEVLHGLAVEELRGAEDSVDQGLVNLGHHNGGVCCKRKQHEGERVTGGRGYQYKPILTRPTRVGSNTYATKGGVVRPPPPGEDSGEDLVAPPPGEWVGRVSCSTQ